MKKWECPECLTEHNIDIEKCPCGAINPHRKKKKENAARKETWQTKLLDEYVEEHDVKRIPGETLQEMIKRTRRKK